jgi:hypothetical protein
MTVTRVDRLLSLGMIPVQHQEGADAFGEIGE